MNARVTPTPNRLPEILPMPRTSHIAVYRDALGQMSSQRLLCIQSGLDADAMEEAHRQSGWNDVFCDVFEIVETRRVGGIQFRED